MKKIALILTLLVSGCAFNKTAPKNSETVLISTDNVVENQASKPTKNKAGEKTDGKPVVEAKPIVEAKPVEIVKEVKPAWTDYKLFAITLDKNKKPVNSKSLPIENIKDSTPFANGPKISIADFATANSEGKILQINCKNADIKQKFDSAANLPGWALEITCGINNFFFMVNKKTD